MGKDYKKIYDDFKLNRQYWFAELKSGDVLNIGFGFIENEDSLTTWEEIAKLNLEDCLSHVEGFYILDGTTVVTSKKGKKLILEDLGYNYHSDDDSFVLLPKKDVVKVWFENKEPKNPIKIGASTSNE